MMFFMMKSGQCVKRNGFALIFFGVGLLVASISSASEMMGCVPEKDSVTSKSGKYSARKVDVSDDGGGAFDLVLGGGGRTIVLPVGWFACIAWSSDESQVAVVEYVHGNVPSITINSMIDEVEEMDISDSIVAPLSNEILNSEGMVVDFLQWSGRWLLLNVSARNAISGVSWSSILECFVNANGVVCSPKRIKRNGPLTK